MLQNMQEEFSVGENTHKTHKAYIPIKWLITASLSLFVVFQFFLQGSIGIMSSGIKESFQIDAASISILSSSFFYSYIILQIPAGLLLDRFGLQKVVLIALCCLGIACFIFAFSYSLELAIISRILMGCGACFAFLSMLKSIHIYFPKKQFSFLMSLCECGGMLGVALSNAIISKLTILIGWRYSMHFCALMAFLLAYILKKIFEKEKMTDRSEIEDFSLEDDETKDSLLPKIKLSEYCKEVFFNKFVWINGVYAGCVYSIVTVFVALWGIPFVQHAYKVDVFVATSLVSTIYIGVALFSPIVGWLSKYVRMHLLMQTGAGLSFILISCFLYLPPFNLWLAYSFMFMLGAFSSVYQFAFAMVGNSVDRRMQGVSSGLTNMLCMSGAPILQPIIGILLSMTQRGFFDGYEVYSVSEYRKALFIIPVFLLIAFVLSFLLKEKDQASVAFDVH